MKFDFSDLFNEMKGIKHFEKDVKRIRREIIQVATLEMQDAIRRVYFLNAPRLKGKAQKFVIPLPNLQKAVVTTCRNGVVRSYIDETQLDHGSDANAEIFIDVNKQLIAKRSMYRRPGLRMTKEEKILADGQRRHPEEYYVRNMDEYWQMPLGSISELEYIERAWTFRLDSMKSYYIDVIKEYRNRLDKLKKFYERALAVEDFADRTDIEKKYEDLLKQKELQANLDYFVKFRDGKLKFDEKEV